MSKFPPMSTDVVLAMKKRQVDIGSPFSRSDLHHAILSKRAVMGMPEEEQAKIHDPRNLLKIEHGVHLNKPIPEGVDAAPLLYAIYGRDAVLEWYCSINFKHRPFELP